MPSTLQCSRLERYRRGLLMRLGSKVFDASRPEIRGTLTFVGPAMASVRVGRGYRKVNVHHLRRVTKSRKPFDPAEEARRREEENRRRREAYAAKVLGEVASGS